MAEKNSEKTVNEEVNAQKAAAMEKETGADRPVEAENGFDLEQHDAFLWLKEREENGYVGGNSQETEWEVPLKVQRNAGKPNERGVAYDNYAVAFNLMVKGEKQTMRMVVVPPQPTAEMYNLARLVCGDNEYTPLRIVKSVMYQTRNNKQVKTESYAMRCYITDDLGAPLYCTFKPQNTSDRAVFQNLLSVLRARSIIS